MHWNATPTATLVLTPQLPVASFDSIFPCAPTSRDCLPQPGIVDPNQYLDILSYRQRPTFRLAYRNFGKYESLVTNQSVEALPGVAGPRWYEIRRTGGAYSVYQQGTYAPGDGVHRWMGSIAQDRKGNMALGYSVVNGVDVYPGIRYTGRLAGDPLGQMTQGEATIINGSGVQTTTQLPLGRLHRHDHRPVGRLHLLLRQRVLHRCRSSVLSCRLADAHRQVQVPELLAARPSGGGRSSPPLALLSGADEAQGGGQAVRGR